MKKILKVLTLVVSLSLIICAIAISATAVEEGRLSDLSEPWQYTDSSGTVKTAANLSTAVTNAATGSTVKLLCNQTVAHDSEVAKINKKLTVDLGGNTYMISQSYQAYIQISATDEVVFKNGTIVASGNSSFGKSGAGYAIFRNGSNVKFTLENVNTYSSCILLSGWSNNPTLTINGGQHYIVYSQGHMLKGGLIEARLAATANINDAFIYLSAGTGAVSGLSFNSSYDDKSINYTFNNCQIITKNGVDSIIGHANENNTIIFNGCDIYGSIEPTLSSNDLNKGIGPIKEGSIILGGGTRVAGAKNSTICNEVVCKSGDSIIDVSEKVDYNVKLNNGSLYYDTSASSLSAIKFSVTPSILSVDYNSSYGSANDYKYSYKASGKIYYTNDLLSALAKTESEIKLLSDHNENWNSYFTIARDTAIDLSGHTLTITENGDSSIRIENGANMTFKNGKIIKQDKYGGPAEYPLFTIENKSTSITLDGVSLDASSLVLIYEEGCEININGGVHGNVNASNMVAFAYVDIYGTANINVRDAVILAGNLPVFSSLAPNVNISLEGVSVIGDTADAKLIDFIDANNKIILDDCDIYASFEMLCNASAEELRGAIVLGEGTRFVSLDAEIGMIASEVGKAYSQKKTTETIKYIAADGTSVSKSCTFEYTVVTPDENAVATYIVGNMTLAANDLATAFASADAGSEIILLKDLTLVESKKGFIEIRTDNLTLNLAGNTLEIIQQGEANIAIYKDLTIKNGTIRAAMDSTVGSTYQGRSYPVLCYGNSTKGVDIVLDNVNSYAGSLVFAWNCSGHSLTVIGGRHHAQNQGTGNDNGWLDVRGDFKFRAENSAFYINSNTYIVSSLSFKDTDTSVLEATFDFVGCDIISSDGKASAIGCANENSKFTFTNCDIFASLDPILGTNDKNAGYSAIKPGAITLSGGVRLSSVGTFISGGVIVVADGCVMSSAASSERVLYEGYTFIPDTAYFVTEDKAVNASYGTSVDRAEDITITIKWYKEDGVTLIREDKVTKGTLVTPPGYTAGQSNGWFKTGYSGWSASFSSSISVTDFTAIKNISYYPCVSSTITADLTVAKYNLSLVGKVCNNLYLPVPPTGVSIKGVYVNGTEIAKSKVVIDGVKYYVYTVSEIAAARLNTVTTVTVKYAASGVELNANISLNPANYAETILKDSTLASPVYSAAAHAVAADLVRYSNALCLVVDGVTDSKLNSLTKAYGNLASELVPSNSFAEYRANTTPLKGLISSIALEVTASEPRWVFNVVEGANVVAIEVEVEGYLPTVVDGINFGKLVYKAEKSNTGTYFTEYIPIYNLDRLMTVRVFLTTGGYVEGKYSLNAYYNGFSADSGNYDDIRNFLKAFRSLGASSAEYKYGTEIKHENKLIDFFECDHENIGAFYEGEGRYCPDCATYVFFYSDFGAIADGKSDRNFNTSGTNNHEMFYKCHKAANAWKESGHKTAVQAVGGAHNGTCYYIGKQYLTTSASIMTDTSWNGAEFIVDDRTVSIPLKDGFSVPIFTADVASNERSINYTAYAPVNGLAKGSKNVGFAPGRPMMLQITDSSRRNNIRQGANENDGESIHEMIIVDEYGNISNDTPVEWDYYNVAFCKYQCTPTDSNGDNKCDVCTKTISKSMSITGFAIDVDPITVSGLDKDGNINFVWETVTDNTVDIEHYTQCGRRFKVQRSNVTVMGIDHIFTEDDTSDTPRTAYAGIVNVSNCNNTVIKTMLVTHHISHAAKDGVGMGSYEFSAGNACNVTLIGYRTRNFFGNGGAVYSRGLFGTNYIRNFYLKDCVLTSFDSHSGAYNAVLEDCVFEHINFVGGGNAYLKNVTVYVDSGQSACVLRQDYGSMWNGNIYFDGVKLRYSKTDIKCIDLVEASYTNWNFGTETYLPEEIIANNVVIEQYSRDTEEYVVENGTLKENIIAVNNIPLGIHYNINKQMVAHLDYSSVNVGNLDAKHPTKRVEINNCGNIQLLYPNQTFFSNMQVFVDGVEQDWFVKNPSLQCEDMNGDKICDVCTYNTNCSKTHPATGTAFVRCDGCGSVRYKAPGETLAEVYEAYEYTSKGKTVSAYSGTSLNDVIANADAGTTIKLLADNTVKLTGTYSILKDLTVDLNGKTLTVYSASDVAAYHVGNDKTLTWQGEGTVICMIEGSEYTKGRPLTSLGTNATVNYNDVTAFVSCLAFSYNSDDVNINIDGGEYYAIAASLAGQSAFIETRANVTLNAKDAIFCLTYYKNIISSTSYMLISATNNYADGNEVYNDYTFTNCDIIKADKGNLINYANAVTTIRLYDCRVYGKLNNGTHYSADKNKGIGAPTAGLYVIGSGTRLLGTSYVGSNVTYADGCSNSSSSKSMSYTFKKLSGTGTSMSVSNQTKSFTFTNVVS